MGYPTNTEDIVCSIKQIHKILLNESINECSESHILVEMSTDYILSVTLKFRGRIWLWLLLLNQGNQHSVAFSWLFCWLVPSSSCSNSYASKTVHVEHMLHLKLQQIHSLHQLWPFSISEATSLNGCDCIVYCFILYLPIVNVHLNPLLLVVIPSSPLMFCNCYTQAPGMYRVWLRQWLKHGHWNKTNISPVALESNLSKAYFSSSGWQKQCHLQCCCRMNEALHVKEGISIVFGT